MGEADREESADAPAGEPRHVQAQGHRGKGSESHGLAQAIVREAERGSSDQHDRTAPPLKLPW